MKSKVTSSIAGATILITILSLAGKGFGFIREVVFANYFGMDAAFDLYLVGAVIPITINTVVLYIALNYFVPGYVHQKKTGADIPSYFTRTLSSFTLYSFLISLFFYFFSEYLVELYLGNVSAEKIQLASNIFRIFVISIPLNAAASVMIAYRQAEFDFILPFYSQFALNMIIILLILLFNSSLGIFTIPAGYLAGNIVQLLILFFKSRHLFSSFSKPFSKKGFILPSLDIPLLMVVAIESISQMYFLIDRYFFDSLPTGGIAAPNYAINIYLLPIGIFTSALTTAILPRFSNAFGENSPGEIEPLLKYSFSFNLLLYIPVTFIFFFYGETITRLIFQRGEFTHEDTIITADVLRYYSISIAFYATYAVLNKLLYGLKLHFHLLVITIAGILLKIIFSYLLVDNYLQNGLSLSTSISFIFYFIAALYIVYRKYPDFNRFLFIREFFFLTVNGFIALFVCLLLPLSGTGITVKILQILFFILIFAVNLKMIKYDPFNYFINVIKSMGYFQRNRNPEK